MTTTNDKIIRVFARRTSMTPTDELAFCDEPPLFDLPELPVRVSVAFTWDIPRGGVHKGCLGIVNQES